MTIKADIDSRIARACGEIRVGAANEMEVTICTLTEDELDTAILVVGEVYETLLRRRAALQREMAINAH